MQRLSRDGECGTSFALRHRVTRTAALRSLALAAFGVQHTDLATFAATATLLMLVAFLASYLPAPRHAHRPDDGASSGIGALY